MRKVIYFGLDDSASALLRSLASAMQFDLRVVSQWSELKALLASVSREPAVVMLELTALIPAQRSAQTAVSQLREIAPATKIALSADRRTNLDEFDREWAKMCGADVLLPKISAFRWRWIGPVLARLFSEEDSAANRLLQRATPFIRAATQLDSADSALQTLDAVEGYGVDLAALAVRLGRSGGVSIRDRTYHLRNYPECFVASEAVTWIEQALNVSRQSAVKVGEAMQTAGLIYHVAREQTFADAYFFFRVSRLPQQFVIADFYAKVRSAVGFESRDRSFHGTEYKQCFVGKEAIAWCLSHRMSLNEAMSAGQRLIDLSMVSHVVNEHPMKDDGLFYRFHSA